jgi:hypothetical protein
VRGNAGSECAISAHIALVQKLAQIGVLKQCGEVSACVATARARDGERGTSLHRAERVGNETYDCRAIGGFASDNPNC